MNQVITLREGRPYTFSLTSSERTKLTKIAKGQEINYYRE